MSVELSVVVPTRDRKVRLAATLEAIESQCGCPDFEIIVVDDGSHDGTTDWLQARAWNRPYRLRRLPTSGGPAAARNAGIDLACGEYVALLGDDTVPLPGWLAAHARARGGGDVVAIGHIGLPAHPRPTRFMRYVAERGPQFGFALIEDPDDVHYRFCYGSNVSMRRSHLVAEPFDESFGAAAWEDVELGYRLHHRGLRMVYLGDAVVEHHHPMDLDAFLERQFQVGRAIPALVDLHPELGPMVHMASGRPAAPAPRWLLAALTACARSLHRFDLPARPLWWFLCREQIRAGLSQTWTERGAR